jgi:hypothetical protein
MGLNRQSAKLILAEHAFRPIMGDVMLCGRQTVHIGVTEIRELMHQLNIIERDDWQFSPDQITRASSGGISDSSFFAMFTNAKFESIDISSYEGATNIHDMCMSVPEHLEGIADFIYNGSCMDNVFDPCTFLINTSKMLKPGGRIVHIEHASLWPGAYLMFSPEWFFNYYAMNQFADCKIYMAVFPWGEGPRLNNATSNLFSWSPVFTKDFNYDHMSAVKEISGACVVLCIAEKDSDSTCNKKPVQSQYRTKEESETVLNIWEKWRITPRPLLKGFDCRKNVELPLRSDHFKYLGGDF